MRALLAALAAGAGAGVFLGEYVRPLAPAADAFVRLLQMAVLPYVTVSIVGAIGGLTRHDLSGVGRRAGVVLLGLWTLALGFALLTPLCFPATRTGAFFSSTLVEPPPDLDLVALYIPANPFFALANNVVPAVVVFSVSVGIALAGMPRKRVLLDFCDTLAEALQRVTTFVLRLMPIGVFAISAVAAGTLRLEHAGKLELYIAAYGAFALVLGLWALPGLVAAVTGIPVRAVLTAVREPLVTATIAGDFFIVLPALTAACRTLLASRGSVTEGAPAVPDLVVPIAYNFPHAGKLLSISFVLFAGWFSDATIPPAEYGTLAVTSLVTLFGNVNSAMPFLLDTFRVPADTFQLFVASGVINARFGTLVAAMHIVAIAVITGAAVAGTLRWRTAALVRYAGITMALLLVAIGGTRLLAGYVLPTLTQGDVLADMRVEATAVAPVVEPAPVAGPVPAAGARLAAIAARRTLRVGMLPDALPFAYRNSRNEMAGLEVAMMHQLARELGVALAFVPVAREALDRPDGATALLRDGVCDVIIGGIAVTTTRAGLLRLSASHMHETLGFVVRDDARRRFASWDAVRNAGAVTIGAPDLAYYVDQLRARLPEARFQTYPGLAEALAGADAVALPAERGSAWTLRYPQYAVVVPEQPILIPLALALPRDEPGVASFIDTWIELKRRDGTLDALYRYWILGLGADRQPPRWSIIRDVLHWVE